MCGGRPIWPPPAADDLRCHWWAEGRSSWSPSARSRRDSEARPHREPLADSERGCPVCKGTLEEMGELTEDAEEVTVGVHTRRAPS